MKNPTSLLAACAALVLLPPAVATAASDLAPATAALQAGDLAAAERLVAPLAAAQPPDGAALHLLSQVRLAQKRTKEAVEVAEAATKADPTRAEHFSQLGMALSARMPEVGFMQMAMLSGRMKSAFEKSVELDPRHVAGLIGLCRFHVNAPEIAGGSLTKAAEYATRLKALVPSLGEAELGRVAEKREDLPAALAHYEASLALRAEAPNTQVAAGRVLAKLGRKDEARARFEAALRLKPDLAPAQQALAELDAPGAAGGS